MVTVIFEADGCAFLPEILPDDMARMAGERRAWEMLSMEFSMECEPALH
jgi:hypothetical protein